MDAHGSDWQDSDYQSKKAHLVVSEAADFLNCLFFFYPFPGLVLWSVPLSGHNRCGKSLSYGAAACPRSCSA